MTLQTIDTAEVAIQMFSTEHIAVLMTSQTQISPLLTQQHRLIAAVGIVTCHTLPLTEGAVLNGSNLLQVLMTVQTQWTRFIAQQLFLL